MNSDTKFFNNFDIKAQWFKGLPTTAGWWLIDKTSHLRGSFRRQDRRWYFFDGAGMMSAYGYERENGAERLKHWRGDTRGFMRSVAELEGYFGRWGVVASFSNFWPEDPRVPDTRDHSKNGDPL